MKKNNNFSGIGVGYVSVMMIFAVICLTVFAVLSLRASSSSYELNKKSNSYTTDYYTADNRAKAILAELDETAYYAHASGFFEDSFGEAVMSDGVKLFPVSDGFRAEYSVPLNNNLALEVKVIFYSDTSAHSGARYAIISWNTSGIMSEETDAPLNVWDGENL